MKKLFTVLIFIAGIFAEVTAKPLLSYIIPDIGAPGMNVYVEFIAPHDADVTNPGNFGADGLYLNNPGDVVRVRPLNAADEAKIVVGPVVVSWNGRLISTQVFINPDQKPDNNEALKVSAQFQIPLVVEVNGVVSDAQTFYIVKPYPYFDGLANPFELKFGEGALGRRSPRGAIIFDSIRLAAKTYRVSLNDCDPNTGGNQGFLPFILLSKGSLEGTSLSTGEISRILVSGGDNGDGLVQTGGAGGGGGGGSFADFSGMGFKGGDGFTGGGPGGRNKSGNILSSDEYTKPPSSGSGPYAAGDDKSGGFSINGVAGAVFGAYEAAGGGTGHPFGSSGSACSDGNNCDPSGGYGGGSGYRQRSPGGSGGYYAKGSGSSNTGGNSYGNAMGIPLAGGSGGAGGNPECLPGMSGAGGGGGGAIIVSSTMVNSVNINANGSVGASNGCNGSHGGGGSGGFAGLLAKMSAQSTTLNAVGGANGITTGGAGRVRYDSPSLVSTSKSNESSYFRGITTDTSHYVGKNFTLSGSQTPATTDNPNPKSTLYIKDGNGNWSKLNDIVNPANGLWTQDVQLQGSSQYHYLVAVFEIPNPVHNGYEWEPSYAMSQSAANLLIVEAKPNLAGDSIIVNDSLNCIDEPRYFTAKIWNKAEADADLTVDINQSNFILKAGFEIVSGAGKFTLKPGDTATILVRYNYIGIKQDIADILLVPHNDNSASKPNPWKIKFSMRDYVGSELVFKGVVPTDFTFPETNMGQISVITLRMRNEGDANAYLDKIPNIPAPFAVVSTDPSLPVELKPGDEIKVQVKFAPLAEGDFTSILNFSGTRTDSACVSEAHAQLFGKGIKTEVDYPHTVSWGLLSHCMTDSVIAIQIFNNSTNSFKISGDPNMTGSTDNFEITDKPKLDQVNEIVVTPQSGVTYKVKFVQNGSSGKKTASLLIQTDQFGLIIIKLDATVAGFEVSAYPDTLDLGNVNAGFETTGSVTISNLGDLNEILNRIEKTDPALLVSKDGNDTLKASVGTWKADITLRPSGNGPYLEKIRIIFDEPCDDTLIVYVKANVINATANFIINSATLKDTTELGMDLRPCYTVVKTIRVLDTSKAPFVVLNEKLISTSSAFGMTGTSLSYPDTLNTGDTLRAANIMINTSGMDDGTYYADYLVDLYINGTYVTRKYVLKISVRKGVFTIDHNPLELNTTLNNSVEGEFTINSGADPDSLRIFTVIGNFNDPPFVLLNTVSDTLLPYNSDIKLKVQFLPTQPGVFTDSLIIAYSLGGCNYVDTLHIIGNASRAALVHLMIPRVTVNPDLNDYSLPVFAWLENGEMASAATIDSVHLSFDRSIFYPVNFENSHVISNRINGKLRELILSIDSVQLAKLNDTVVVARLNGYTMLGENDYTPVTFDSVSWSDLTKISGINTENGSITLNICEEGGKRLLSIKGNDLAGTIAPNPASESVSISVTMLERGRHEVKIYNLNGNEVYKRDWENTGSNSTFDFEIDLRNYVPGFYTILIAAPNERISSPLYIIK